MDDNFLDEVDRAWDRGKEEDEENTTCNLTIHGNIRYGYPIWLRELVERLKKEGYYVGKESRQYGKTRCSIDITVSMKPQEPKKGEDGRYTCPHCGYYINKGEGICRVCGEPIDWIGAK
jgi:hypothetical protein